MMFNFFKKKDKADDQVRAFNAALMSNWNHDLMTQCIKTNDDIRKSGAKLRDISREMAKNNSDYRKYLGMCVRNIVGHTGIKLQMNVRLLNGKKDQRANEILEKRWSEFSRTGECTVERDCSLRLLDELIVRTQRIDGEVFLRRIRGFNNRAQFAFQILDAAACPHDLEFLARNGNRVRQGIELDDWGAPVAYYFEAARKDQYDSWAPYEAVRVDQLNGRYIRIPADEINHIYYKEFPGQLRGFPFGQSAIQDLNLLGSYFQVELIAAEASSRKLGKLVNKKGLTSYGGRNSGDAPQQQQIIKADPGSIDILNGDWDLLNYDPQHPVGNFPPFVNAEKRNIANGLDVAYNTFANDLVGVNFSSMRSGCLDERDMWMQWQEFFCEKYKQVEFGHWLEIQLLSPEIPYASDAFERLNNPVFLCRRWQWVDPVNDAQSNILQMSIGATTPQDVAANLGNDFDDNIEALQEAGAKLKAASAAVASVQQIQNAISQPKGINTNEEETDTEA